MGLFFPPRISKSLASNIKISNADVWLQTHMLGSGSVSFSGELIHERLQKGISRNNHLAQNWPLYNAIFCCFTCEISLRRCNKYGGKSAIGKAKHIEAINAIIPIFESVADNFEIPCDFGFFFEKREDDEPPPLIIDPSNSELFEEVRTNEPVRDADCCP